MRLGLLRQDLDSSRRTISYQQLALAASIALNIVIALIAYRLIGLERVILVPPSISKSFCPRFTMASPMGAPG